MYIRTKEGHIYEYVEQRIHPSQYLKFGQYRHNLNSEYEQIIAQADTIEELCDEFVCVSKDNPKSYIIDDNLWGDVYPYYDSEKDYLYGAIWTDKGLIYVAKLIDGEFVLI